ncbi:hypothetical protein HK405_010388, partial [Cladochytrium tenue]
DNDAIQGQEIRMAATIAAATADTEKSFVKRRSERQLAKDVQQPGQQELTELLLLRSKHSVELASAERELSRLESLQNTVRTSVRFLSNNTRLLGWDRDGNAYWWIDVDGNESFDEIDVNSGAMRRPTRQSNPNQIFEPRNPVFGILIQSPGEFDPFRLKDCNVAKTDWRYLDSFEPLKNFVRALNLTNTREKRLLASVKERFSDRGFNLPDTAVMRDSAWDKSIGEKDRVKLESYLEAFGEWIRTRGKGRPEYEDKSARSNHRYVNFLLDTCRGLLQELLSVCGLEADARRCRRAGNASSVAEIIDEAVTAVADGIFPPSVIAGVEAASRIRSNLELDIDLAARGDDDDAAFAPLCWSLRRTVLEMQRAVRLAPAPPPSQANPTKLLARNDGGGGASRSLRRTELGQVTGYAESSSATGSSALSQSSDEDGAPRDRRLRSRRAAALSSRGFLERSAGDGSEIDGSESGSRRSARLRGGAASRRGVTPPSGRQAARCNPTRSGRNTKRVVDSESSASSSDASVLSEDLAETDGSEDV